MVYWLVLIKQMILETDKNYNLLTIEALFMKMMLVYNNNNRII
jgi:hypothetical protein